ncbi:hypothetical protein LDJ81_03585 [Lentilactobacillus parabuchneri]|uniref:hypothetical protein n=1 Tax=Lentilactobacillus parabuchneri TaxID=152331 RepID=UPI002236932A|nr:hypothetical protein [Lentilactobacillus parabuchneri]MCW4398114.1 hypothetical protein [Lentilactobacillus parabuchneri]
MPKKRRVAIDAKNKQVNFFKNEFLEFFKSEVYCHTIGRVISYDKAHHRCDVQPLPLQSDGDKRAALTEVVVPASVWQMDTFFQKNRTNKNVNFNGYKPMAISSVVWVGFCDREMDNWSGRNNYKIDTKRMHSIQDAVIEAVIEP